MQHDSRVYLWARLFLFLVCGLPALGEARTMIIDNPERVAFSGFASSLALVGDIDGDRYCPHRGAIPVRRTQGAVLT